MKFTSYHQVYLVFVLVLCHAVSSFAQTTKCLSVYIDCNCDKTYLRQELSYVNHVRDQALADIQLFVYDIGNGSGGQTYTLNFIGKNTFNGQNRELNYKTTSNMTNDEIRSGLSQKVALGLLNYLLESDLADQINFTIEDNYAVEQQHISTEDSWKNWVFKIYGEGELEKESSRSQLDLEFGFEGDRVTDNWRVRLNGELNHSERRFKGDEKELLSVRQRHYVKGSVVRSLGSHWSAGVFGGFNQDTYNNLDRSFQFHPAIEFNVFPYREVLRREITLAYKIGYTHNDYIEKTIYGKTQEQLLNHSFDIEMRVRQPWGDIASNLEASAYLHDLSKNRIELDSRISVRVFKGLAVQFFTNLDLIRDQINLPEGDASLEDILLRQRQIATDFEVSTGIGLSYTFGSVFNNIVNTRL